VTVFLDGAVAGTAVANGSGNWSFMPSTALSRGPHSVAAQATDAAGNTGPISSSNSFTVTGRPRVQVSFNGTVAGTMTSATQGHPAGCATAPTFAVSWVAVALGIGCLRSRRRGQRVQSGRDGPHPSRLFSVDGLLHQLAAKLFPLLHALERHGDSRAFRLSSSFGHRQQGEGLPPTGPTRQALRRRLFASLSPYKVFSLLRSIRGIHEHPHQERSHRHRRR
jgi:hypothetical protein